MSVTSKEVSEAVGQSGLGGLQIMVHSSLRSFGWVLGGARAVIEGLMDQGSTVIVPTFLGMYEITPPNGEHPSRNGIDYDSYQVDPTGTSRGLYSPYSNEISESMGAIPETILKMRDRHRGNHPRQPFAAIGPCAAKLVADQSPLDPFNPIRKLSHSDGMIVLMGVGLTKMTALHMAEQMAGRNLFRRCVQGQNGKPMQVAIGGCSGGFHKLESVLASLEHRLVVGESLWRIFAVSGLLNRASKAIRRDPMVTHCGKKSCLHCDDAVAGGPLIATN